MNIKELHNQLKSLAPYQSDDDDYRDVLREAFRKYMALLKKFSLENVISDYKINNLKQVEWVINKINDIAYHSYKGLPSTAFYKLKYLLEKIKDQILYENISVDSDFYRIRTIKERRTGISFDEMFHIPISNRGDVKTERYSTPGFPCLYLGKSVYGCWEEMKRPLMNDCWCSRLHVEKEFRLLDLRVPTLENFTLNFSNYLNIYPIIIACMIPVKHPEYVYKSEYIITQLIIEWIIKNKEYGVLYTSAHRNNDFNYPEEKYENVAMPVKDPIMSVRHCRVLADLFSITNPINYEIESLKEDKIIDCGGVDTESPEARFKTSVFEQIENWLRETHFTHKLNKK